MSSDSLVRPMAEAAVVEKPAEALETPSEDLPKKKKKRHLRSVLGGVHHWH